MGWRARRKKADVLLKNTFEEAKADAAVARSGPIGAGRGRAGLAAQQLRLAEHVFYPPQAVEQGLEGEVRLLLRLDEKGRILEARIASTSGHDLLDRAALDAAYATGAFPAILTPAPSPLAWRGEAVSSLLPPGEGIGMRVVRELILPVVFRLSE